MLTNNASATARQTTFALCDNTEHGAPFHFSVALIIKYMGLELPVQFHYTKGCDGKELLASQRTQILMKYHLETNNFMQKSCNSPL